MSFASAGLSKFLVTSLVIGGVSYSISQIVGNSSSLTSDSPATRTEQTQQVTSQSPDLTQRGDSVQIPKKKCTVFLTSEDGNYWVVFCNETNPKTWYLFNQSQGSLDKIEGLTSQNNNAPTRLDHSLNKWKSREWTGIKEYDQRLSKVKETLGGTFKLKYNSDETIFPFFNFFRDNGCVRTMGTLIRAGGEVEFSCKSFNITSREFENRWNQEKYKKAFNKNGDSKCYAHKNSKWEETSCSDGETSSSK